ncbi:MAG: hypothetical protein AAFN74_13675 [Myxococcota bacterium]
MTTARLAAVCLLLAASCADRGFVELPEEIRWLAVVQDDRSTPLVPYTGQTLATYIDPARDAQVLGFFADDLQLDAAMIDSTEDLRWAASCPQLPAASWQRRVRSDGNVVDTTDDLALTTDWFEQSCADLPAENLAFALSCDAGRTGCITDVEALGNCRFRLSFRDICGYPPLTINMVGERMACATGDAWSCEVDAASSAQCTLQNSTISTSCTLTVTTVEPPFTVDKVAVRPDAASQTFAEITPAFFFNRGHLLGDGVTQGLVVVDDRVVVSALDPASADPIDATNEVCFRRGAGLIEGIFHAFDASSLQSLGTTQHPGCFRGLAAVDTDVQSIRRHPNRIVGLATLQDSFQTLTQRGNRFSLQALEDDRMVSTVAVTRTQNRAIALLFKAASSSRGDQAIATFDLSTGVLTSSVSDFDESGILNTTLGDIEIRPNGELLGAGEGLGICRLGSPDALQTECSPIDDIVSTLQAVFTFADDLFFTDILVVSNPERWVTVGASQQDRAIVIHEPASQQTFVVRPPGRDFYPVRVSTWAGSQTELLITGFQIVVSDTTATGYTLKAVAARFDLERRRLEPGLFPLGRGFVDELRIDSEGRVWGALPWDGAIVRLTPR